MERRLAIIFPGVGYHVDKPLLYYSKQIVESRGYECISISYNKMPTDIKGDEKKKQDAFDLAKKQVEQQLTSIDFNEYKSIIFISKSLGSILATDYAKNHSINVKHILFTPVQETLSLPIKEGIVFHGTKDSWIETEDLVEKCNIEGVKLYLIEDANHSLEIEDVLLDLDNLRCIMKNIEEYVKEIQ